MLRPEKVQSSRGALATASASIAEKGQGHGSGQQQDTKFFEVLETSANNISTLPLTTVQKIYQNTTTNLAENIPVKLQELDLDVEYLNDDGGSRNPTAHWEKTKKNVCAATFTRGLIPHIKSKRKRKVIQKLQECLAVDKNSPINPVNYRRDVNSQTKNSKKFKKKIPLATGISVDIADVNFSSVSDLAAPTIPTYQKNHSYPETHGNNEDSKEAQQKYNESQLLQYCGGQSNPPTTSSIDLNKQVAGSIKGPYTFIGNNSLINKDGEKKTNKEDVPTSDFHQAKAAKQVARAKEREEIAKAEEQVDSIREYTALLDLYSSHHFLVFNGKTVFDSPEFESFKASHASIWGPVITTITALEKLLRKYDVPVGIINGPKLAKIATLESFRLEELLSCVANADQIESLIKLNKLRAQKRGKKRTAAVILIQSVIRMFLLRNSLWLEKQKGTVSVKIQSVARGFVARQKVKKKLRKSRELKNEIWVELQESLMNDFQHISHNRDKFLIFLPSLSIEEHLRLILEHVAQIENMNLNACLEGALDSSTHVVYISPQPLPEEVLLHLRTLLERYGLGASKLHVLVPENSQIFPSHIPLTQLLHYSPLCLRRLRYLIRSRPAYIVPSMVTWREKEIAIALEIPILCGIDIAKQSELSLRSGGKRACMEAGVNVPIGAHDIYNEEQLALALTKLIVGNLDVDRWLIKLDCDYQDISTAYLDVIKALPESVPLLRIEKIKLEEMNEGVEDPWLHPDVQMIARSKVMTELQAALPKGALMLGGSVLTTPPESATTSTKMRISSPSLLMKEHNKKTGNIFYADYPSYLAFICRYGCVIEAEPKNIQGYPVVHLLIEPIEQISDKAKSLNDQTSISDTTSEESKERDSSKNDAKDNKKKVFLPKIEVKATHDTIIEHARYGHIGALYPATSAPQSALIGAAKRIGQSLYEKKGVIGYLTLRFVIFADHGKNVKDSVTSTSTSLTKKKRLRMWATGVELGLTQLAASHGMYILLSQPNTTRINEGSYLTEEESQQMDNNSLLSGITGAGDMQVEQAEDKDKKTDFHYLVLPRVGHPSLQHLSFTSFFKSCRLEGISFSLEYRAGPSFLLYDSLLGGTLGIMAMAHSPERALHFGLGALAFLRRTLGTRDLPTTKEGRNLLRICKVLSQLNESMHKNNKASIPSSEMESALINR